VSLGESIITNLAADGGGSSGRMARVSAVVGYDNTLGRESADRLAMLHDQMDFLRYVVLSAVRNSTYEEMTDRYAMPNLAAQILQTLQNEFATNEIVSITFTEWMIH
jgi:hypothetical protein